MERIERRDTGNARVPFTGIPVELGDDELPGGFEADAWDLGAGGVGLRSAFLPKIGSRLHCRFRNPEDGTPIEARGEVVWADEAGPHEGAFGLRFESLDGQSAEELDRLIGAVATIERGGREMSMPEEREEPSASPAGEALTSEIVQIELDGVAQALTAELVHESGDVVLLEQSLDFLTLERRVRLEDGREGLVAAVDLRVEGDTPRLVMTLAIDPDASSAPIEASKLAPAPEPSVPAPAVPVVEESRYVVEPAPAAELRSEPEPHVAAWVDRPSERPLPAKRPADVIREGLESLVPYLTRLRAFALAFFAKASPIARRLFENVRAQSGALAKRLLAKSRGLAAHGARRARRFGDALPRTLAEKRGDVRPPQRRPQRRQAGPHVPIQARTKSRTQLVIGIGVVFALLFGVGLLVHDDGSEPADGAVSASESGADEVAENGRSESSARAFGMSSVPNAMIFDLVLESAASRLEGSEIEDGVLVRIPGGRSVSRAGAIAANHPDVEYAAIRNLDGAAELEIRFVPGREPVYRVELRGSIVRVSIMP
jgi:hypothetical protein